MRNDLSLLVWTRPSPTRTTESEPRLERRKLLDEIAATGAKVRYDSGGSLFVIELPEAARAALLKRLPRAKLLPLEPGIEVAAEGLEPGDALFLDAVKLRVSASYREAKAKRQPGESPEESLLSTGSCVRGY